MVEKVVKDKNGELLCKIISNESWPRGLSFFTNDDDFIQVGTWKYDNGKKLNSHKHLKAIRTSDITQEVIHVVKGKLKAIIYDIEDSIVEEPVLSAGDTLICFIGGHGYEILEDDTRVLEVKNGPYLGIEKDKMLISENEKDE